MNGDGVNNDVVLVMVSTMVCKWRWCQQWCVNGDGGDNDGVLVMVC